MFSTSFHLKKKWNVSAWGSYSHWFPAVDMSVEINSCPQRLPFPEYQFAHTLNSTLTKLSFPRCSSAPSARFWGFTVFVQGGSRPMWLSKSSPAAVNGHFSLPFFWRSGGQGYTFIFFVDAAFPCPSSPAPVCWPAGLLVAGGWGAESAFLSRICLSDQTGCCTLQEPSEAGSLTLVLESFFYNMYQIWVGFHSVWSSGVNWMSFLSDLFIPQLRKVGGLSCLFPQTIVFRVLCRV